MAQSEYYNLPTWQDYQADAQRKDDTKKMAFAEMAIDTYKNSEDCKKAVLADEYYAKKNRTIMNFFRIVYAVTGQAVDNPNAIDYKLRRCIYPYLITNTVQYSLSNGVTWSKPETGKKLGNDFDNTLQDGAVDALNGGVAYGFWNLDHVQMFKRQTFVPLVDEENSALRSGIRFWRLGRNKPLRASLMEEDGYTEYIWRDGKKPEVLRPKQNYIIKVRSSDVQPEEIYDGMNYPSFPVVPFWGNKLKQSALEGLQEQIDAYDLIKSGFANSVEEASFVYWAISGAGGMKEADFVNYINNMRRIHAALTKYEGASAEPHSIEAPYASREALLDRLERDIYRDYLALDTYGIASGAATATQIKAAYEPENLKANEFEYCVLQFLNGILNLAGIEGEEPTFSRDAVVNTAEEINSVLAASEHLSSEYTTRKILTLLGDGDKADQVIEQMQMEEMARAGMMVQEPEEETEEENA